MKIITEPVAPPHEDHMLPLINIVLLLMVFFMLMGSVSAPSAFKTDPPQSKSFEQADTASTGLALASDGRLAWGRELIRISDLELHARIWGKLHEGEVLRISADATADADLLIEIMEGLRSAGIERVNLLARNSEDE